MPFLWKLYYRLKGYKITRHEVIPDQFPTGWLWCFTHVLEAEKDETREP